MKIKKFFLFPSFTKKLLKKGNKSPDYLKSRVCYLDIFDSVNFIFFFNVSTS